MWNCFPFINYIWNHTNNFYRKWLYDAFFRIESYLLLRNYIISCWIKYSYKLCPLKNSCAYIFGLTSLGVACPTCHKISLKPNRGPGNILSVVSKPQNINYFLQTRYFFCKIYCSDTKTSAFSCCLQHKQIIYVTVIIWTTSNLFNRCFRRKQQVI